MNARLSIRWRLTLWYSAVLLAGLALFGCVMWFALWHRLISEVDQRLAARIQGLRTVIDIEDVSDNFAQLQIELSEFAREVPEGSLIQVRDGDGRHVLPFPEAPAQPRFPWRIDPAGPRYETVDQDGREFRVLTARIPFRGRAWDAVVANSLDEPRAVMGDLRSLLLLGAPGVVLIACIGGYWISRRALAPVDDLTRAAKSISARNLSSRLAVPATGDELQRLSETLNQMLGRLEATMQRITRFTADASHELRTPVALIHATAEIALRRDRDPAAYRKALAEIQAEADQMARLTDDLLLLARSDSGVDLPLARVDLNAIATDAVGESRALAEACGVRLADSVMSGDVAVRANADGVRRIARILIDNALKHTPAGGEVIVSTSSHNGSLALSVRDTGEGIPAEALPHIFERFYQADASRNGNGAGLGLSIAQAIAQAHGATIEVESAPGQGACFRVILPRSREDS